MKISAKTIQLIKNIITGESSFSPYRSGPKLVEFFSQFGSTATYDNNFPSRAYFTERELLKLNNFEAVIEALVDPRDYLGTNFSVEEIVKELNKYLLFDGYELLKNNLTYKVFSKMPHNIKKPSFVDVLNDLNERHHFILEQEKKCQTKIENSDFDGAITNARSMLESVFAALVKESGSEVPLHESDLNKLFKEVKKCLNLEPHQNDLNETLKQILSGLTSLVSGVAGISNKMGDRHARQYKPQKHHALLAVSASYILCEFLIASREHQSKNRKPT